MKRTLFFLMVLLSNAGMGFSQSHFSVVWSGNGLDQMNVNVMSATLDGNALQVGDEIAVFDGIYCVGTKTITDPAAILYIINSKDDETTPAIDGYTTGHTPSFKMWDASAQVEITDISVNIVLGSLSFQSSGTLWLNMTCTSCLFPIQPSVITGNNNPCQGATGVSYSVTNVSGVTYTWTVPSGWSVTAGQGTNAINVTVGSSAGNVSVTPSNICGSGTARTLAVTVNSLPSQPDAITGNNNPCQAATGVAYSVTNVSGVTYTWTVPSGWSVTTGQGTNAISVTVGSSAGNVSVTPSNTCGNGPARTLAVTVSSLPAQPGSITGSSNPCQGATGMTYSVTNVSGVTYTWAVPSGWSVTTGQGTNAISVTVGSSAGNVSVTPSNACGNGTARTLAVNVNTVPAQPVAITGNNNPCQAATGVAYSVTNVSGVTYTWAVPSGWSVTTGQGTNAISVTVGSSAGNVSVTPSNTCGNGTARTLAVTVSSLPAQPDAITGNINPCQAATGVTYSVTNVSGVTYTWAVPSGWSVTTGQGTNAVTVTVGSSSGNVSVTPSNTCGNGSARTLAVTVNPLPAQPGSITGNNNPCLGATGVTYSVTNVSGVTYTWTVPSGWSVTTGQGTNAISVTVGSSAGNVSVTPSNTCGNGTARTLAVTVNTIPAQPVAITGNNNPCLGTTGVAYSVTNVSGVTYTWAVPSGWSITAGQGTNAIAVSVGSGAGNVSVTPSSTCGNGTARTLAVTVNSPPSQPDAITGNINPCQAATGVTYSVTNVSGVTYTWAVPSGWSITAGQGTNAVTLTVGASAGNISVTPSNTCGNGTANNLAVTVNPLPAQPGTIAGNNNLCQGATGVTYSVTNVSGVTYTWAVPSGWSVTAGQGTNAITVTIGSSSGNVSVTPSNTCGNGTARTFAVSVNTVPEQPGTITGSISVCQGSSQTYSITAVTGAATYSWTLPSGWTGSSSSISINATAGATGGTISVTAINSCGTSTSRTLNVSVPTSPQAPITTLSQPTCTTATGIITITAPLGTGMTYSINGSTYTNTNGIFSGVATGTYTVTARNSDGCTSSVTSAMINAQPATPSAPDITLNGNILTSSSAVGNQWYTSASGLISGATQQNYTMQSNGDYYVTVTLNGCTSAPSDIISFATGIEKNEAFKGILIYPNPAHDKLTIVNDNYVVPIDFDIMNSNGKTIYNSVLDNERIIDLSLFSSGMYFIRFSEKGSYYILKFIKE